MMSILSKYIVDVLQTLNNHDITLDNGEHLIVSRTRIKSVKIALMNYWGNQV